MKFSMKTILSLALTLVVLCTLALTVFASEDTASRTEPALVEAAASAEEAEASVSSSKAWAAAILLGVASLAGAFSMGMAISKSADGISRQPEAAGQIRTGMMLGLVFIETVIIYALIIAILIIFVL